MKRLPAFIALFLAADMLLVMLYLGNGMAGQPFQIVTTILDLDGESSVSAWYSALKLSFVAICLGLVAWYEKKGTGAGIFALLAFIFLSMSMDEVVQMHEYIGAKLDMFLPGGERKNTVFAKTGIWMFVLGLPAVATISSLFMLGRAYFPKARAAWAKSLAGLALFAFGAVGVEIFGNFVAGGTLMLQVAIEEFCEMLGVTILLWAGLDFLKSRHIHLSTRPNVTRA